MSIPRHSKRYATRRCDRWNWVLTHIQNLWVFSEILESVAVLPQLVLLRQTTVPTVIDSYYLACLGSYRGFYILNWITRVADKKERHFDPVSVIFGVIQTALYLDFFWVYYSRQRVKLRAGGIVDSDDFSRGWLIGRIAGKQRLHDEEDGNSPSDEHENARPKVNRWGNRSISVSADDTLHHADEASEDARPLTDPNAFEDELSDDEGAPAPAGPKATAPPLSASPWAEDEAGQSSRS
jgi:ER lumen protein retaining receptor